MEEMKKADIILGNIRAATSSMLHVKDAGEIRMIESASKLSTSVLKNFLVPQMEEIIDEEKKVSHVTLADRTDDALMDEKTAAELKLNPDDVESCFSPIIQSGSTFDLRLSAESTTDKLAYEGAIVLQLGGKYKSYCSNIARTYFINPTSQHTRTYKILIEIYTRCKSSMRPGKKLSSVMYVFYFWLSIVFFRSPIHPSIHPCAVVAVFAVFASCSLCWFYMCFPLPLPLPLHLDFNFSFQHQSGKKHRMSSKSLPLQAWLTISLQIVVLVSVSNRVIAVCF
jgi:Metallopeptidase family M24